MNNNYNLPALMDKVEQLTQAYIDTQRLTAPLLVGIHTAGVWLAQDLHQRLKLTEEPYMLNVSFYRDDFQQNGLPKQKQPSHLPIDITDRHIILVDDVLHSGRTVRAAMNELFDYGRPASISLAVVVSRGHRQLPIEAQVAALHEEPGHQWRYHFEGPEPMSMCLVEG